MSRMRTQLGVTIIEVTTMLVIVVILTVLAAPTLIDYVKVYRLRGTVQNLYQNLQYARSEAIKRNDFVFVGFQGGNDWCYGLNPSLVCFCNVLGLGLINTCTIGTTTPPTTQQTSLSVNGYSGILPTFISFDGTRGTTSATTTITLTIIGTSTSMSVKINPLGNMSICSSTVSGYPACT